MSRLSMDLPSELSDRYALLVPKRREAGSTVSKSSTIPDSVRFHTPSLKTYLRVGSCGGGCWAQEKYEITLPLRTGV